MVSNNQNIQLNYLEQKHNTTEGASAIEGMPAATRCTRNSMDTSQDFMQGTNSIKNVANSRDASSSIKRQHEYLGSSRNACNNRPAPVPATAGMPAKKGGPQRHAWTPITARDPEAKCTPETVGNVRITEVKRCWSEGLRQLALLAGYSDSFLGPRAISTP
jgi:hypothetical protein